MPRTARASAGGICYHVLNRGNACADVFHKAGDYAAFVDLLAAANERPPLLAKWPVPCPRSWLEHVNAPQTEAEVLALQRSIDRGTPFGNARWQRRMGNRVGLEASLRPRGRPRKGGK